MEARDATEHHHREHEAGEREQPAGDGATLARNTPGRNTAPAGRREGRGVHAC